MNDSELSLAVARIIYPDFEWEQDVDDLTGKEEVGAITCGHEFDYTSDDTLGKMCVWLAARTGEITDMGLRRRMISENPHRAIAEAIVEASK